MSKKKSNRNAVKEQDPPKVDPVDDNPVDPPKDPEPKGDPNASQEIPRAETDYQEGDTVMVDLNGEHVEAVYKSPTVNPKRHNVDIEGQLFECNIVVQAEEEGEE